MHPSSSQSVDSLERNTLDKIHYCFIIIWNKAVSHFLMYCPLLFQRSFCDSYCCCLRFLFHSEYTIHLRDAMRKSACKFSAFQIDFIWPRMFCFINYLDLVFCWTGVFPWRSKCNFLATSARNIPRIIKVVWSAFFPFWPWVLGIINI